MIYIIGMIVYDIIYIYAYGISLGYIIGVYIYIITLINGTLLGRFTWDIFMGYESLPHQEWWFNGIIIGLYLRNHGPCGDLRIFGTIEWGCEMLEDGIGIPRLINFAPIFFWVYSNCNCPFMQGWWLSSLFDDDNPNDN